MTGDGSGAGLDRVAPGLLVGSLAAASDGGALRSVGVSTVVSLIHTDPDEGYPDGCTVERIPMVDGPRNDRDAFEQAVRVTRTRRAEGETVLVHCAAGASRSVAVAATALALLEGVELDAAFHRVVDRRETADPHPALVRQAARVYLALSGGEDGT